VFPEPWHLQQQICLSFCAVTKQQLGEILENKASPCRCIAYLRLLAVRRTPCALHGGGLTEEPALILHCRPCAGHIDQFQKRFRPLATAF